MSEDEPVSGIQYGSGLSVQLNSIQIAVFINYFLYFSII
jgi:hypothetical protein